MFNDQLSGNKDSWFVACGNFHDVILPPWPIFSYLQDVAGLGIERRWTQWAAPQGIGKYCWGPGPETITFYSLVHLVFAYLEDRHLHFTCLDGHIRNQLCTAREGLWTQLCPSAKLCSFLLGSIQSLAGQSSPRKQILNDLLRSEEEMLLWVELGFCWQSGDSLICVLLIQDGPVQL